jgi:hypothetical protein
MYEKQNVLYIRQAKKNYRKTLEAIILSCLAGNHTFTFIKLSNLLFSKGYILVDTLTSFNIMPVLRRMNFCIVINTNPHPHPCYGSSMNIFNSVFQIDVFVNYQYSYHHLDLITIVVLIVFLQAVSIH